MNDPIKRMFQIEPRIEPMEALRRAARAGADDPTRPVFHFLPPGNWMNDPNGPIYHDGYYHVFYQLNPFTDSWGDIHWGHARSRDMVHWEHLPIALSPSVEQGEACCYSGTCTIRRDGTPVILYTKVGPSGAEQPFEQWMAIGDDELLHWRKYEHNPVLSLGNHDGPAVLGDWRDPFVFDYGEQTYMVLGAVLSAQSEEHAAVLLYRAANEELTEWEFLTVLLSSPKYERGFLECPNFVPLDDDNWILFVSPYHPVEYYVGEFELEELRFTPKRKGRVDHSIDFYASNTFPAPDGRRILLGWVGGFKKGRQWNGCLSLPREIGLAEDGMLIQRPVRELKALRGRPYSIAAREIRSEIYRVPGLQSATVEVYARIRPVSAGHCGLRVRMGAGESSGVEIALEPETLIVAGMKLQLPAEIQRDSVDLHLFLDNSVLELFVLEGRVAVTKTIYPPDDDLEVGIFADGHARVEEFTAWPLASAPVSGFPS